MLGASQSREMLDNECASGSFGNCEGLRRGASIRVAHEVDKDGSWDLLALRIAPVAIGEFQFDANSWVKRRNQAEERIGLGMKSAHTSSVLRRVEELANSLVLLRAEAACIAVGADVHRVGEIAECSGVITSEFSEATKVKNGLGYRVNDATSWGSWSGTRVRASNAINVDREQAVLAFGNGHFVFANRGFLAAEIDFHRSRNPASLREAFIAVGESVFHSLLRVRRIIQTPCRLLTIIIEIAQRSDETTPFGSLLVLTESTVLVVLLVFAIIFGSERRTNVHEVIVVVV